MTWHNVLTLAGTSLGGLAGAEGLTKLTVESDKGAQTGLDIAVIATGTLAGIATTAAGMEASAYAANDCAAVLAKAAAASL